MNKGLTKRIRVIIVLPQLDTGGSERVAVNLALHLDPEVFDVAVMSLYPYSGLPYEKDMAARGLPVYYLSKRKGFDWRCFFEVNRVFRRVRPHVVQNHLHHLAYVLPAIVRNWVPVCLHRFSSVVEKELSGFVRRLIYAISFRYLGVQPVAISERVRESARQVLGSLNMPVVFSGVDVASFTLTTESRSLWRDQNQIQSDMIVFVNVARFHPAKNQALLIRAFAEVAREIPEALLLLVGDGELLQGAVELANRCGLREHVRFLNIRNDIAEILNAADVFVLASEWEGVPVSVLEAMASGKPIIATAVGGVSEIVRDDDNGILVAAGNCEKLTQAMLRLCRDRSLLQRLGERGRQMALERFDVSQMSHNYGELYRHLLTMRRKKRGDPALTRTTSEARAILSDRPH